MSADKAPDANLRAVVFAVFAGKRERADERTRTADLLQLRVSLSPIPDPHKYAILQVILWSLRS
jgi:hypothetical protein